MPVYRTVIFDIDGTLLKSDEGSMKALKYTTDQMGVPFPPQWVCQRFIGPPLHFSFHEMMGMSEEDTARAICLFNEYYIPKGVFESELYPGVLKLIQALHRQGVQVCVATSKSQAMAEQVVSHYRLSPYISYMETKEDDQPTGEKKDMIRRIIEKAGTKPEEAVMIGDTRYDAQGARENHMGFIGVTYGYGTREEMEEAGAVQFAADAEELGKLLGVTEKILGEETRQK